MNAEKAGLKGGSGKAEAAKQVLPVDWKDGGDPEQPDNFGVVGADARDQEAENINGGEYGPKSGALEFPPRS